MLGKSGTKDVSNVLDSIDDILTTSNLFMSQHGSPSLGVLPPKQDSMRSSKRGLGDYTDSRDPSGYGTDGTRGEPTGQTQGSNPGGKDGNNDARGRASQQNVGDGSRTDGSRNDGNRNKDYG